MRGPIAFWAVLLGSVAVLFIGLWLASPHAEEPSSTEIEAEVSTEDPVQLSTSQEAMSDSQVEAADPGDTWWSDEAEPTSEPGWSFGSGADRSSLPETIGQGALTVQQAAYRVNQSGPALVIISPRTVLSRRQPFRSSPELRIRWRQVLRSWLFQRTQIKGSLTVLWREAAPALVSSDWHHGDLGIWALQWDL